MKITIAARIEEDLKDRLQEIASRHGTTLTAIIEEAAKKALIEYEEPDIEAMNTFNRIIKGAQILSDALPDEVPARFTAYLRIEIFTKILNKIVETTPPEELDNLKSAAIKALDAIQPRRAVL